MRSRRASRKRRRSPKACKPKPSSSCRAAAKSIDGPDSGCRQGGPMDEQRRKLLQGTAAMSAAALAGGAPSADAQTGEVLFAHEGSYIPVVGSNQRFQVRRVYCVGRNYAAHAREMGSDPTREPPFFFQKPTDAIQLAPEGTTADHPYPPLTKNYHYEIELVAALHRGGKNVPVEQALNLVYGYAIGLDMTRRDLQRAMGDEKKPWEIGKSFDRSAPIGPVHRVAQVGHFRDG